MCGSTAKFEDKLCSHNKNSSIEYFDSLVFCLTILVVCVLGDDILMACQNMLDNAGHLYKKW